jgi:hypothetical protein
VGPGPSEFDDDRDVWVNRREEAADHREADADQRERLIDARERVLDRWERELSARAEALNLLDPVDEERRRQDHSRRDREREQRRADSEVRRDAAIDRDIERAERAGRTGGRRPAVALDNDPSVPLTRLARALQDDRPFEEVLELILATAVAVVPGCEGGGVALTVNGRLQSAASTAAWAAALDAIQIEHGGPLPEAAAGGMVRTAELRSDHRWPALASSAPSSAGRGVLSFGLVVGDTGHGVLTLYSQLGTSFGDQAWQTGEMLAAHAALALRRTLERVSYVAQTDAWQRALASRDMIGQAKGILMEQRSSTADEAFDVLRATSQRLNVKLRDVAEHVVATRRLPES